MFAAGNEGFMNRLPSDPCFNLSRGLPREGGDRGPLYELQIDILEHVMMLSVTPYQSQEEDIYRRERPSLQLGRLIIYID